MNAPVAGKPVLHALAIGGTHQFAHFLPVACEIERRGNCKVRIFVSDADEAPPIQAMARALGLPVPEIVPMTLPAALAGWVPRKLEKLTRLLAWAGRLRASDAILCAERTSTLLRRLPGHCPPMIHIPHGAGDRRVGFEKRFSLFDQVLVAGAKDRDRLIAEGVVLPERCGVTGPVKVSAMLRINAQRAPLFASDRPVLLYNPHFDARLGSGGAFTQRLVDAVAGDDRYNLVIAPHVRMARDWSEARRREWRAMAVPGRIVVDLASERSIDMTYTLAADLYIGDVSSQVYEFLVRPRPCLFVNAHAVPWQGNEDYAMWRFGEVITPDCDVLPAIARAFEEHPKYRAAQVERTRAAFEGIDWTADGAATFGGDDPIDRAADIIESVLLRAPPPRRA